MTEGATAGVAPERRGLASAVLNTSNQVGFAVGVAALSGLAVATTRSAADPTGLEALVAGYRAAFVASAALALLTAIAVGLAWHTAAPALNPRGDAR
ncbi:MAG: hypothetical protein AAGA48_04915 [Myxococcota bacterium]